MVSPLAPGAVPPTTLEFLPWGQASYLAPFDFHIHTNRTDGTASPQEMADSAVANGMQAMLFSEHVRHTSTFYPNFITEVKKLRPNNGLQINVGIETKALNADGELDCSAEIVSLCDAVIASVHSPPSDANGNSRSWSQMDPQTAEELEFELAMGIVKGSQAHVLAHPMGMVVTRFGLKPIDRLIQLAEACKEYDKAFELNTRYCSSPEEWLKIVQDVGCKISFGSDAHRVEDVGSAWHMFTGLVTGKA